MTSKHTLPIVETDTATGTCHVVYHYPDTAPSHALSLALLEITDDRLSDFTPLYDSTAIDPDALDDLFRPSTGPPQKNTQVEFTYHDFRITVKTYG